MRIHELQTSISLNRDIAEIFDFFSMPENLEQLTPPWLCFQILTPPPIEMRRGSEIDYRIRVHGIPMRWRSEITTWDPPHRFVDEQRRGPYRLWIHEHTFKAVDTGASTHTIVRDHVRYAVPGGALVHRLFVRRDIERIFAHRHAQLTTRFGAVEPPGTTTD